LPDLTNAKARLIAFYLPQYHPIPENDTWWGKGFTEWTNTAKAKPLFKGHYQPHLPADLGFYDLRVPETRLAQAELARKYGIEAFCYYHYWFAGRRILERPFDEVLTSGKPDFPFCLCWANASWTGVWYGAPDQVLIEQTYPGMEDHRKHFDYLLQAFRDSRYLRVEGKPVFIIFQPTELPDSPAVIELWQQLARKAGLPGLFILAIQHSSGKNPVLPGFDGIIPSLLPPLRQNIKPKHLWKNPLQNLKLLYQGIRKLPTIYHYENILDKLIRTPLPGVEDFPCIIPNWDNTPRSAHKGLVFHKSSPELFRKHLQKALQHVADKPAEKRLVFVKSWNEWAEGNHLEPDQRFGKRYLQVLLSAVAVESAETQTRNQN